MIYSGSLPCRTWRRHQGSTKPGVAAFVCTDTRLLFRGSMMITDVQASDSELRQIEDAIRRSDGDSLRARWRSGQCLLSRREGKRLPNGVRELMEGELGLHRTEITARMKFAEKFSDEAALANVISQFASWFDLKQRGLKNSPADDRVVGDGPEAEQHAEAEPSKGVTTRRRSVTPSLRRMLEFLEDIESADLRDTDLQLLSEIIQLAERHREAAIALVDEREAA